MCNKEERRKAIDYLVENVSVIVFIQKQPYTAIQVKFHDMNVDDQTFTAFAKCVYPDVWSNTRGRELVLERCASEAYKVMVNR